MALDEEKIEILAEAEKETELRPARVPRRLPDSFRPLPFGIALGATIMLLAILTARPSVDLKAIREEAREGVFEAVATLEARSGEQPVVETTNFTLREANRIGEKSAPVTIVEFADFQCPYCARIFQEVEPELLKNYVSTGKVTFVYKHFPFLGKESIWAAQAAECAADQGKFWEYHNTLFTNQAGENTGAFTKDRLIGFARNLALDLSQFEPCLRSDATLTRVRADHDEAQQARVGSTPTFFINGKPFVGAQPYKAFHITIEQMLQAIRP